MASLTGAYKADRTVLRFGLPQPGFAVAVEDVLARGDVSFGGFRITANSGGPKPNQRLISATETLLTRVRKQPDQTLERALALVHNPVQDLGPMMISLACDNRKFVVQREGEVLFNTVQRTGRPARPHAGTVAPRPPLRDGLEPENHAPFTRRLAAHARDHRQGTIVSSTGRPRMSHRSANHRQGLRVGFTTERSEWSSSRSRTKGPERLEHGSLSASPASPTHPSRFARRSQNLLVTTGGRILAAIDCS